MKRHVDFCGGQFGGGEPTAGESSARATSTVDGNTDILWRNISGAVEIWMMNGLGGHVGAVISGAVTVERMTIVAHGRFHGSGNDDTCGAMPMEIVYIWFMNGTADFFDG